MLKISKNDVEFPNVIQFGNCNCLHHKNDFLQYANTEDNPRLKNEKSQPHFGESINFSKTK